MLGIQPEDKFKKYKILIIQESTHEALQIAIPSKVRKNLLLKKGQRLECHANTATKEILYKLVDEGN